MPRSTFGVGILQNATPGLSRLAQAFAGGDQTYQGGFDQGLNAQSKIAQVMSQIRANDAAAQAHTADAALKNADTQILGDRSSRVADAIAAATGTTRPDVDAFNEYQRTGQIPMRDQTIGPPTEEGLGPQPIPKITPELVTKIGQQTARMLPFLTNKGDIGYDSFAKGTGEFRNQDLSQGVINGTLDRNTVAGAQAAAGGKPLYHFNENGEVGDLFGGKLDETGGLARGNIALRGAQAGEQRAAAANQYASAGAHNATAAKTRQETEQGGKTGQVQIMTDGNGNIVGVNKATMVASPAIDALTGKPVQGKGGTLNAEQANALGYGTRMTAAQKILDDMAKEGVTNGGVIKQMAEHALGDAGAMGVNSLSPMLGGPSSQQQQVEQAQRDFVNAILRRESGAAISSGEFANARQQYFDQPGDEPAVRKQKRAARDRAIQTMMAAVPQNMRTLPPLAAPPGAGPAGFRYLGKE